MGSRLMMTAVVGLLLALPAAVAAQHEAHGGESTVPPVSGAALPEYVAKPIELHPKALGPFTRPISSKNAEAQAFFDQGMQMMYAFAWLDAIRSFREAWKRDPDCAVCYWGEGWAWGSYLNGPMTPDQSPFAYAATQKALELRAKATPKEQAFIDALAVRYVKDFNPETRVEQDRAYAEAMGKVAARYPDDLDAGTLYADALFLLEPRRGRRDINSPSIQRLHGELERVLAMDIRHPGACHLYVHATESTTRPEKAEACAEFLGDSIPGASHINHMPSHTFNVIGRWADSVRGNLQAWHSDLKAEIGEGFAIYPSHNLHMLLFAASMDGQGAVAIQAGKDYAKLTDDSMYHVLTLVRFGRFDEIPAVTARPSRDIPAGMWDFAQGYAKLREGDVPFARAYLARVTKAAEASTQSFRVHPARVLLGIVGGILEGEILRAEGDLPGAITVLERAAALNDELDFDEPEPLPFAARHWLGAALLEAERWADAERVYRESLRAHPNNGWSLHGLQRALAAQGTPTTEVDAALAKAWARSDTWLRSSRF